MKYVISIKNIITEYYIKIIIYNIYKIILLKENIHKMIS